MPNPTQTLPLSIICNVSVEVSPQAAATPSFNQGLIVGPSTIIPSQGGTNPRIRQYASLLAMAADGFSTANPEYVAAELYFGQQPAPQILWIGCRDLTAVFTATVHAAAQGTGYVVGDVLTIVQGGAQGAQFTVTTIGTAGAVTAIAQIAGAQGTGYSDAVGLATTGGTGNGAQVDITAVGETPLQSLQACRAASPSWWACMSCTAVKADHEAIAAWAQATTPQLCYFFTTADADAIAGTAGNVLSSLKASAFNRAIGTVSTTQGGAYPQNAYFAAGVMGEAMGLNTGLANSYFTLKFKTIAGVATEPLPLSSIGVIEGNNGNISLSYANSYSIFEQGVMANGQFFDEILNLDMLASDIQYSVLNLLTSNPSVPQTDAGETQIINVVTQACERARTRGFIAQGTWEGQTILNLEAGDPLPLGYLVQAQSYINQSKSDRQARKGMPLYIALVEAGATHSLTIGVEVQR